MGEKVKGAGPPFYDSFGYHCEGCDVVFHGCVQLTSRAGYDPESRTGKCGRVVSLRYDE